jgi:tRNA(Ile)-lysidine synthase TilS/MesJ
MDDVLDDGTTPCSLCAKLRRGVLYRLVADVGATKITFGHHADDFVETLCSASFLQEVSRLCQRSSYPTIAAT